MTFLDASNIAWQPHGPCPDPSDDELDDLRYFCLGAGPRLLTTKAGVFNAVFTNMNPLLWAIGETIIFGFCDGNDIQQWKVVETIKQWLALVNLNFKWERDITRAKTHIRICFAQSINHSAFGKQPLVQSMDPTMRLGAVTGDSTAFISMEQGMILHEWGHVLGLHHEHKNPALEDLGIRWDRAKCNEVFMPYVSANCGDTADLDGWVRQNITEPLERNYTNFSDYDPYSVMTYSIPQTCFSVRGPRGRMFMPHNNVLSRLDKAYMSLHYPKPQDELIFKQALLTLRIPKEVSQDWDTTNTRQKFWLYHNQLRSPNLCIFVDEPEDSGSVPSGTYEIRTQTNLWSFESDSRIMRHESHFAPFGARLKEKAQDLAWVLPDLFLSSNAAEKLAALNEFVAAMAQDIGVRNMEFKAVLREFLQCPDIIA